MAAKTLKNPYRFQKMTFELFSSRKTNQNTKRKTESYVFSGFGNCSAADNENRQMEDLPQATDFGREPERSLLPVRTNSITEDFAC